MVLMVLMVRPGVVVLDVAWFRRWEVCLSRLRPPFKIGGGTVVVDRDPLLHSGPDPIGRHGLRRHLRAFMFFGLAFLQGMALSGSSRGRRDAPRPIPKTTRSVCEGRWVLMLALGRSPRILALTCIFVCLIDRRGSSRSFDAFVCRRLLTSPSSCLRSSLSVSL